MASPADDKESTPLLFSPKGGGHLDPANNGVGSDGPRRRAAPPPQPLETHYFASKFDPPQIPKVSTNSSKYRSENLATPIVKKIYSSYSILKDAIQPMTKPSLADEKRQGKIYYEETYNDLPWRCSCGTHHEDGIWLNHSDKAGLVMSSLVWLMIVYAGFTVTLLVNNNSLPSHVGVIYCTLCALALASHAKTALTDPGSIPKRAIPNEDNASDPTVKFCNLCETYKPPKSHHCRICDRCISGMDHHCPWMNNCIGTANLKHFFLFLIYVWTASAYALVIFGMNYFLCNSEECIFPTGLVALVRLMTFMCVGALIFTSNMLMSVFWGIMTGMGTIDRMKKQEDKTFDESEEEPMAFTDIFGIGSYFTWFLPIDPIFNDYDRVMGYSNAERLQRERSTIV